jgi:YD repeat-containing protein
MLTNELLYTTSLNGFTQIHRIVVTATTVDIVHYNQLPVENSFQWEFNHSREPIIHTPAGIQTMSFTSATGYTMNLVNAGDPAYTASKIERPDLYTKVYPFQWIQGDYNGDGKTDIGIFHLKESVWYFAMTQGTVPDLIYMVDNGIGGRYTFEYANSSSFDNTGVDNIPDLPMNYKVCTKLLISDGMGREVYNTYTYQNGKAFSAYINNRKETDFFGFSNFTVMDAQGSKTENIYNATPYASFLLNRALAGALKESRFTGYDSKEYSKTQTDYAVHEIHPNLGYAATSYLVYPSQTRKYITGVLTQTQNSSIDISAVDYRLLAKTESVTDHYSDAAHPVQTTANYTQFEYAATTNQQRIQYAIARWGTPFAVKTSYVYDSRGNALEQRTTYTGGSLPAVSDAVMKFEYDGYGNKTAEENTSASPARRTEYMYENTYHQFAESIKKIGPVNLTETVQYDYSAAFGKPVQTTDANGNSRYLTYDALGRLIKTEADTDSGKEILASYIYSSDGSALTSFPLSAKTIQYTGQGNDIQTRVFTDGAARELHTIQSATALAGKRYTKSGKIMYDALGRVIRKSQTGWAKDN